MRLNNRWFQLGASRGFIGAAGLLCGLGWAGLAYVTTLPMLVTANAGPIAKSWGFTAGALAPAATLELLRDGQVVEEGSGRR